VGRVLFAEFAILFHFKSIFQSLFIFFGEIIDFFTFSTLKLDHVVLRHIKNNRKQTIVCFVLY
jgi:hypothetical protein